MGWERVVMRPVVAGDGLLNIFGRAAMLALLWLTGACSAPNATDGETCEPGDGWVIKGRILAMPAGDPVRDIGWHDWIAFRGDGDWSEDSSALKGPCQGALSSMTDEGLVESEGVFTTTTSWVAPSKADLANIKAWYEEARGRFPIRIVGDETHAYVQCAPWTVDRESLDPIVDRPTICEAMGYRGIGEGFWRGFRQGFWPFGDHPARTSTYYGGGLVLARGLFIAVVLLFIKAAN
jgi:hypothetical protein